MNTTFRR